MYNDNNNLVNLFIKLEYLNSNYINLEFNDYLKKNVIHIAYNSPSFFLTGIFLKYMTNNIKIIDSDKCEKDEMDEYMSSICKTKCNITDDQGNLTNIIDQKAVYKPSAKNKTLKNIKFSFDKHYKIQLKLDMNDDYDSILIEKMLDCNQKIYNIIKHNANFSRKYLKKKMGSPRNSSSTIEESSIKVTLPPPGIYKRSLVNESNSQTILFNDIVKRVNSNEYCIDLFCDYKTYKCIQSKIYNEKINYGSIENKEIGFNISKIVLDDNNEVVPLVELINYT